MTLHLNERFQNGGCPAAAEVFTDGGSFWHLALGVLAGSEILTPRDSVMMATAFAGYQLTQAQGGVPWSRTGGELIEFAAGMLLARFLPQMVLLWRQYGA